MSKPIVSVSAKRVSVLADSLFSAEALIETWILGRKPDTVRSYLKSLALFTDFIEIAPGDLKEFLSHVDAPNGNMLFLRYAKAMQASKAASNTIATRLTAVRSFLSLCRTAGWINWMLEVKPGIEAVQYRDTRGPGHKGFAKIINGITGVDRESRRDRAIIWLLYSPALRRAEVSKIDLGDLDLEEAQVMIWQKKKRDQVSVTLPPEAVSAIMSWLEVRALAGPCGENDPLGPQNQTTLNPATISNAGGSQPHSNMQPYLSLTFCIALQGIFPSRN